MDWFRLVLDYFNAGYYTADQVKVFVVKGKITNAQYQTITGIAYVA